jgi:hypothetical protein
MENGYSYVMNALISLDQMMNAVLGGSCDETLSSRAYRMANISEEGEGSLGAGWWSAFEKVVDTLFWFDRGPLGEGHCMLAYQVEMRHGHLPKSMSRAILMRSEQ